MKIMTSVKTLLRLLGAGVLTASVSTEVAACCIGKENNNPVPPVTPTMDPKVAADFGFVDTTDTNISKVVVTATVTTNATSWISSQLDGITADKLLVQTPNSDNDRAVSIEAGDFLVNVFKLQVVSGTGADRLFKHTETNAITMSVKTWLPTIDKLGTTDYVVNGGTVVVQFKNGLEQLGEDYSLNILQRPTVGIINNILPAVGLITLANFNPIDGFAVGSPKDGIIIGQDLVSNFKLDVVPGKIVKSIVVLINQGTLAFKVAHINANRIDNFDRGDKLKVTISIGTITFANEYTLTLG